MALTVDSPILLPRHWANPGAPIVSATSVQAGVSTIARALNSLYEQHRGTLVADYYSPGIITASGQVARYRVLTAGRGSLTETATTYVMYSVAADATGLKQSTLTVTAVGSGDTQTKTITATPAAQLEQWYTLTGTLEIIDSTEHEDITLELTDAGNPASVTITGVAVIYDRARATLDALGAGLETYAGNGFCPIDLSIVDDNYPLSPALLYTLHGNARDIYKRAGAAITSAFPAATITGGTTPTRHMLRVPEGVSQLCFSVYCASTHLTLTLDAHCINETRQLTSVGWVEFELDVDGCVEVDLLMWRFGSGTISAISAHWGDRSLA